ncbi:CoB--CoM heterodisulfide reductase subunit B [Candidatus Harpocratesius sp.]
MTEKPDRLSFSTPNFELNYSLFLGCVIPNRYPMIERASRKLFDHLNIGINEMEGASCCPAPGVFRSVDKALWLTVGARNISIAERHHTDIISLCNGCYGTLHEVNHQIKHNDTLKNRINTVLSKIGRKFEGNIDVKQIVEVLYYDYGLENLKKLITNPLGLRVAVHYGCHLLKPSSIKPFTEDPEDPHFFDELVEITGSESVDYRNKIMCCGAGGSLRTGSKENSLKFTLTKLRSIRKANVDCIVTCCPFCQLQFDLGQLEVKNELDPDEDPFNIPVIYISQLLGLAMGLDPIVLGMIKPLDMKGISPFIPFDNLLQKLYHENRIKTPNQIEKKSMEKDD